MLDCPPPTARLDTSNRFTVARTSRGIMIMGLLAARGGVLSDEDAFNLAGWLVAMTGRDGSAAVESSIRRKRFDDILEAIERT